MGGGIKFDRGWWRIKRIARIFGVRHSAGGVVVQSFKSVLTEILPRRFHAEGAKEAQGTPRRGASFADTFRPLREITIRFNMYLVYKTGCKCWNTRGNLIFVRSLVYNWKHPKKICEIGES